MKIFVYTAIIGNIDALIPALPSTVEHIAFVDVSHPPSAPWMQRIVNVEWGSRRTARHYKACPHLYMPDADVWIWVDGNVRLHIPPEEAVVRWLRGDLATLRHPDRRDVYEEAAACIRLKKDDPLILKHQANAYRKAGHPVGWGLAETRIVIRRNTPGICKLNEAWWEQIRTCSLRDQASLPFVCWQAGLRWDVIPGRCWPGNKSPEFRYTKHERRV